MRIPWHRAATTSPSDTNENGASDPAIPSTTGRSNRSVIWFLTVAPRIAPGRKISCPSSGCCSPGPGQPLLDLTLVVGVGELGVAAQRIVLGQRHRVVGVVAVGGAAAGHDQLPDRGGDAAVDHVLGAEHVDRVLELTRTVGPGRHDRRQMDHAVDLELDQQLGETTIANIADAVLDAGQAVGRRRLTHVDGDDRVDERRRGRAIGGERGDQLTPDVPARIR